MDEQIELTPKGLLTETLSVRGPELTGLLAELRGKGAILLTFIVTGQNHYLVTFQQKNFSRMRNARKTVTYRRAVHTNNFHSDTLSGEKNKTKKNY